MSVWPLSTAIQFPTCLGCLFTCAAVAVAFESLLQDKPFTHVCYILVYFLKRLTICFPTCLGLNYVWIWYIYLFDMIFIYSNHSAWIIHVTLNNIHVCRFDVGEGPRCSMFQLDLTCPGCIIGVFRIHMVVSNSTFLKPFPLAVDHDP
jgi:hypothetical protein